MRIGKKKREKFFILRAEQLRDIKIFEERNGRNYRKRLKMLLKKGENRMNGHRNGAVRVLIYFAGILMVSLGIVLCKKSNLGVSPVSCIPFVLEEITGLSFGRLTMLFHLVNIILQLILARKLWDVRIYLQIPLAYLFGVVIDFFQQWVQLDGANLWIQCLALVFSVLFTAIGMVCMIQMNLVQNPPDGTVWRLSVLLQREMGKVKIGYDISCVVISVVLGTLILHEIRGFGVATIVSAVFVGKTISWIKQGMNRFQRWKKGRTEFTHGCLSKQKI